jgi:hypothetical protein
MFLVNSPCLSQAIKGMAENQKSECASGNASHRWYILRPMTPGWFLVPGTQKPWRGALET